MARKFRVGLWIMGAAAIARAPFIPALLESLPLRSAADPKIPAADFSLSPEDDQFLDNLEKANFLFFWEQANRETGLVKDRANGFQCKARSDRNR